MQLDVVCGVFTEGNKVFAQQKGYGRYKGFWEFPGGKKEENETLEEAMKREIKEELCVDCEIVYFVGTFIHEYEDFCAHLHVFLLKKTSGEFTYTEQMKMQWISLQALDDYEWLAGNKTVLEALKQLLGK